MVLSSLQASLLVDGYGQTILTVLKGHTIRKIDDHCSKRSFCIGPFLWWEHLAVFCGTAVFTSSESWVTTQFRGILS